MELTAQVERLFERRRFGIKPGLAAERCLLEALDHPEQSVAAVHVAGTNGKGSVCAMLASILTAAGFRTGLFTSPHLVCLNERFRVDGVMVDDDGLKRLMERVEAVAESVDQTAEHEITFFECCAAMAFDHFRAQGVQLALLETGMGGRLDATNVVDPALSIITRIDLDHTAYLGEDLASIAAEKAGIIKPGRPVVIGAMPPEARDVMIRTAAERGAPLRDAATSVGISVRDVGLDGQRVKISSDSDSYAPLTLPLIGAHQVENLATVVAACEVLRDVVQLPLPDAALVAGLTATQWEGRLQVLQHDPPLVVDGAHNPGAARALVQSLRRVCRDQPVGVVLGMCADKNVSATLRELAVFGGPVWTVPLATPRGLPAADMKQVARSAGLKAQACDGLPQAVHAATTWAAANGGVVCIAGSLFLAGEALAAWKEGTL